MRKIATIIMLFFATFASSEGMLAKILERELTPREIEIEKQIYHHSFRSFVSVVLKHQGKETTEAGWRELDFLLFSDDEKKFKELVAPECFKNVAGLMFLLMKWDQYRTVVSESEAEVTSFRFGSNDYRHLSLAQIVSEFSHTNLRKLAQYLHDELSESSRPDQDVLQKLSDLIHGDMDFSESFFIAMMAYLNYRIFPLSQDTL